MFCLSMLTVAFLFSGCKDRAEVVSSWTREALEVDGDMKDWADLPTTFFEDQDVQLGLSNDHERLYVLFRFNNESYARQIGMGGLTLWLDNSGKKRQDSGLRYIGGSPPAPDRGKEMTGKGGFEGQLTDEQKERLQKREQVVPHFTVIDKDGQDQASLPVDGSRGPAVAFTEVKGMYTYEFSIPLAKTDVARYGFDARAGQVVSLGLELGSDEEDRKRMMEGRGGPGGPGGEEGGGPPGGGMGGPPGGGMGGPGGPGGMSRPKIPEKQEVWIKTTLAVPSEGKID